MGVDGETGTQAAGSKSIARRLRDRWVYSLDSWFATEPLLVHYALRDSTAVAKVAQSAHVYGPRHLLVPTVGKGNIGDQAMFESFLLNTTKPVTMIVQHDDGHDIPASSRDRVQKIVIPDLFSTRPWRRRRIRRRVAGLIASHSTFSVVGADVMDGAYSAAESSIRFGMLCIANALDTPNRVLGFSWNGVPPKSVRRTLNISQPRSLLCARDPHSFARLLGEGSYNLLQTADVVFTMNALESYDRIKPWLSDQGHREIVIINVSGILARKGVRATEYVEVARHLVQRGCSVIVLPHVIRAGDDDLAACRAMAAKFGPSPHLHLIENLLTPSQVAWVAVHASAVLTGRMHLSILSLNQGVPAAILSTQGKISGVMELFDTPQLMLEPEGEFSASAITALDQILDDPSIRSRISEHLPRVRELSALNFAGLETA
jgi:polysaccharide pyruvyl transferase WcaK-like protein